MTHSTIRTALEQAIAAADLDLYLVPMVDEFQGEYIPAYAARLPYVTGFDGSAGLGVFRAKPSAEKKHVLFVDGRYDLQAREQTDTAIVTSVASMPTGVNEVTMVAVLDRPLRGSVVIRVSALPPLPHPTK